MKVLNAIVETPRGSAVKYDYDKKSGLFKLKKELPAGMTFPYDFGFIPHTKGEDGDPLDILIISEFGNFPGCLVECKLIGSIQAKQKGKNNAAHAVKNDRFIGIPLVSRLFKDTNNIDDLSKHVMKELEAFFVQYNKLEEKSFKIIQTLGPTASFRIIKAALQKK
jgi:inorganic pyrophosphatase